MDGSLTAPQSLRPRGCFADVSLNPLKIEACDAAGIAGAAQKAANLPSSLHELVHNYGAYEPVAAGDEYPHQATLLQAQPLAFDIETNDVVEERHAAVHRDDLPADAIH